MAEMAPVTTYRGRKEKAKRRQMHANKGFNARKRRVRPPSESRPSDADTGYLWGKAGQEMHRKRTTPRGYLWAGQKPK